MNHLLDRSVGLNDVMDLNIHENVIGEQPSSLLKMRNVGIEKSPSQTIAVKLHKNIIIWSNIKICTIKVND